MTTTEILTPHLDLATDQAVELASGLWRKQILPCAAIDYTAKDGSKRKINFDAAYLKDLHNSFQGKAFDLVSAQLAPKDNIHTNDVRDAGGELVSTELTSDGLFGLFRMNETGEQVLKNTSGKVGVSARILEGLRRSDGKSFPRALQHVLLTLDPQIPGMKPWEQVQDVKLSSGTPDETVDLSNSQYPNGKGPTVTDKKTGDGQDGQVTVTLTSAQATALQEMLEDRDAEKALAGLIKDGEVTLTQPSGEADDADDEVDLAGQNAAVLELQQSLELSNQRIASMQLDLARQTINAEVERLASAGLAPALIEAARPLLAASPGAVELTNGPDRVDVGGQVRQILSTIVELDRQGLAIVDLNREDGFLLTSQEADPIHQRREALLASWGEQN
jgi:hypothetical protein